MGAVKASDDQLESWLSDNVSTDMLSTPLPDDLAETVVERLKKEADRYWAIDPNYSLKFADRIVAIGQAKNNKSQMALGLMARGDALKHLGSLQESWEMFEQSGNMYQDAGNEVGWARTRISRLALGPDLNRVKETLADVDQARSIFQEWGEQEKLVRLDINIAYIHTLLGDQYQALQLFRSALTIAEALGEVGEPHLGMLYMNIGYVRESLGDFPQALVYYEKARSQYLAHGEITKIIFIENNIACIAQAQGHYRSALSMLNAILARGAEQFPREYERVLHSLAECYLNLNRYTEARELIGKVLEGYRNFDDRYHSARALLHLATIEVELGNFHAAQSALDEAALIFSSLGSFTWSMIAHLWHGQIVFKQGDYELAWQEAQSAANCFEEQSQQVNYATACILLGQIALIRGDLGLAQHYSASALGIAQQYKVPSLRYASHLLLGRIAKASSLVMRSIRNFRAATATIERVQRGLTITMRSGFLENKGEAWSELISLYLGLGQTSYAFSALEQAKSQVLVSYLNNREQFHWSHEDPESQSLIEELENLRAEHQLFYHLAFNPPRESDIPNASIPNNVLSEVAVREKRMRAITERLYLLNQSRNATSSEYDASLPKIQASIDNRSLLVEFYDDGQQLWAFVLDGQSCEARPLLIKIQELKQLIDQLRSNITASLILPPSSLPIGRLTIQAQRLLQRLYTFLLEPLEIQRRDRERITIVPYGVLHYLPFHLLYDGVKYLIEKYEVVILPAASLATRASPRRSPSALIISNSCNGLLPQTQIEAQMVQSLFGGKLYAEEGATRVVLQSEPSQILHIATHGQHRLDQPDLSYLELADGQLYTDDLLQHDLSYELVTLSACETGRANVAGDEELIGIGRGFLYAGAGALILSQWHVTDSSTVTFMERLYRSLHAGSSKAAALREAQLTFLEQDRLLHPALWGAFQLIGDAQPLSKVD